MDLDLPVTKKDLALMVEAEGFLMYDVARHLSPFDWGVRYNVSADFHDRLKAAKDVDPQAVESIVGRALRMAVCTVNLDQRRDRRDRAVRDALLSTVQVHELIREPNIFVQQHAAYNEPTYGSAAA